MQGYAPGWQVRCTRCQATRDAGDVGIIRAGAWSWRKFAVGWYSRCHRVSFLAVEQTPAPPSVKAVENDDDFSPPQGKATDNSATWQRALMAFAAVAVSLYLPSCWLIMAGSSLARFDLATRWLFWAIMPGFVPGIYLFHPNDQSEWICWTVVTLGLLVGLTWLGSLGRRRFWVAVGLAWLVAILSSWTGYVLIVRN